MRLGAQEIRLRRESRMRAVYGADVISERHRHRYEFNNTYMDQLQDAGLQIAGKTIDGTLVEVVEVPDHPWFIGCQFHPEFTSTPRDGHPLFSGFVEAANIFRGGREQFSKEQRQGFGPGGAADRRADCRRHGGMTGRAGRGEVGPDVRGARGPGAAQATVRRRR